jgi:hypothetical protein
MQAANVMAFCSQQPLQHPAPSERIVQMQFIHVRHAGSINLFSIPAAQLQNVEI